MALPLVVVDGRVQQLQSGDTVLIDKINFGPPTPVTINSGIIALPSDSNFLVVDTEGAAASDDLDDISGEVTGQIVIMVAANAGRTVNIPDGGGANRFLLPGAFALGVNSPIMVFGFGSFWYQMMRSTN